LGARNLQVFEDYALIIYEVKGEWQTKDPKMIPYQKFLTQLIEEFEKIIFDHLNQDKNQFADVLVTLASMIQLDYGVHIQPIQIKACQSPVYCTATVEASSEPPWFSDIRNYIKDRTYPAGISDNHKKTMRRLAMGFFLNNKVLYKRSHDDTLLRCVDADEAQKIMVEVHEGICGTHANGHIIAKQIQRCGYF